ncbi:hypothetical protein CANARDRAFT_26728 [[Candida] arabinofermentans NRRL YB-2248]|uniref:Phosphoribosylformylglycinamidine synthase n=1 Tax=[Candida] arabinofermentans NRRL YB-2248 TaxID=983967 RepID=A0A1E4T6M7_9ASCO|nr:hypothetical protein CANARDRAFT_26728 [[Candida] arabinofermentans NRRL YB-2248]
MLITPGPQALASFRVANLINDINKLVNSSVVLSVKSCQIHYIHYKNELDDDVLEKLKLLLKYDDELDLSDESNQLLYDLVQLSGDDSKSSEILSQKLDSDTYLIRVLPRPGTISPWSSKATNIVEVCGLGHQIDRVERGMAVLLKVREDFPIMQYFTSDNYASLSSIYDRMTQSVYISDNIPKYNDLFEDHEPKPLVYIDVNSSADNLAKANKELGLALDQGEMDYLLEAFRDTLGRNPTDVELFMFAQVNSEHCRHKIFNADWKIDGEAKDMSLFQMIRNTHKLNPRYTISAYSDNAAIFQGPDAYHYAPDAKNGNKWTSKKEIVHTLIKVETHNHPTAVSPFPGAATGSGGEIRDEGAVGRGSKSKCGLSGFSVSDLLIPDLRQPWELDVGKPSHIASPLDIMIEAPLGSAAFNNEFGRPCISGYFRTLTTKVVNADKKQEIRGFHKPIMLAGGMGSVRPQLSLKSDLKITPGSAIIVLGGQCMLIGLGGGAASSVSSGEGSADLDFASVQRGNPEMQRRAQEVINACNAFGLDSPIQCIHDVGAGGLSNALPELVHDNDLGAKFELRDVLSLEPGMSPMEIWCNESQERYVLGVAQHNLNQFKEICERERCPYAVVGVATNEQRLVLTDRLLGSTPIDLDMSLLFGKPPKMSRQDVTRPLLLEPVSIKPEVTIKDALARVLQLPSVGSKSFLITIADRSVTGLIDRDQFVGPWQVPVADVGVTCTSFGDELVTTGEALAMGEKPTLALISPGASAKMCVAESLLNLYAADVKSLDSIKLSANWMAPATQPGEGAALYEAVQAIGLELCPELDISIPVGKDSMSMKMSWDDKEVIAPMSLVITAFSGVDDTSNTWTPMLQKSDDDTVLVLVDLAAKISKSLGGSALAQVYNQVGNSCPTVHESAVLKGFLNAMSQLHKSSTVLAYHDRSDGGLIVTLLEMAFAGRCGLNIELNSLEDPFTVLFNEELGGVFQIKKADYQSFVSILSSNGVSEKYVSVVGVPVFDLHHQITVSTNGTVVVNQSRGELQQTWSNTSYHMQKLRDLPIAADQEFQSILDNQDPGLTYKLTFDPSDDLGLSSLTTKPKVAILREQGVNGQMEMAWCFQQAGFEAHDVHMSDIISGAVTLDDFVGLAACGGFSYGDVLGAANGWATSVLYNDRARSEFYKFFQERTDTFAFGACNGCQFLSKIKSLIPGTENWPSFERNKSQQYEARVCTLEIIEENSETPLIFFDGMRGSRLPISVAHGEGLASFGEGDKKLDAFVDQGLVAAKFVDNYGVPTEKYPLNPNGSPNGIAGIRTPNGRVLAMMPHPERVVRLEANSYYPPELKDAWGGYGPWIRLFKNARKWVAENN